MHLPPDNACHSRLMATAPGQLRYTPVIDEYRSFTPDLLAATQ
jgi:hypothetical protein